MFHKGMKVTKVWNDMVDYTFKIRLTQISWITKVISFIVSLPKLSFCVASHHTESACPLCQKLYNGKEQWGYIRWYWPTQIDSWFVQWNDTQNEMTHKIVHLWKEEKSCMHDKTMLRPSWDLFNNIWHKSMLFMMLNRWTFFTLLAFSQNR